DGGDLVEDAVENGHGPRAVVTETGALFGREALVEPCDGASRRGDLSRAVDETEIALDGAHAGAQGTGRVGVEEEEAHHRVRLQARSVKATVALQRGQRAKQAAPARVVEGRVPRGGRLQEGGELRAQDG